MTLPRLILAATFVAFLAPLPELLAVETAVVKADHVAVRALPSAKAERLRGNLKKGDIVRVQATVEDPKATGTEPRQWARIDMPAKFPVWVAAELVDAKTGVVKSDLANLRGGPGKNYSRVGQLTKGSKVTQVRIQEGWMQIEPPPSAVAYIASDLLAKEGAPNAVASSKPAPPARATAPAPVQAPLAERSQPKWITSPNPGRPIDPAAVQETRPARTAPPEAAQPVVSPAAPSPVPSAPVVSQPAPVVPTAPPPTLAPAPTRTFTLLSSTNWIETKRKVTREGYIVPSANPKAPSGYCLLSKSRDEGLMNYVYTEDPHINLKQFLNRSVTIVGEEWIDPRFRATPILIPDSLSLE